ncbi:MAG: hypothetical protein RMX68_018620 [Aulosira sp. ZfuVER01]|nr:hypothetical protein [Aulosira sp. ZfuVER01]MDZ7998984.1 hypothetical protein [Aulosira sp. DedVER01a]MDZ8051292.1 hypothetical protein [Aulosira sp. ZfuCHP01]
MFNQEVALNNQAWEEITDIQGEAITGGAAPTIPDVLSKFESIVRNNYDKNPNFDFAKTVDIVYNVAINNGAIGKLGIVVTKQEVENFVTAIIS